MGKLHQPHDQFFKVLFSNMEVAQAFMQRFLPDDLTRQLDFPTLRITSNTFLTDKMTSQFADLVLECAMKDFENHFLVPGLLIQKYFKDLEQLHAHLSDIFHYLGFMEDEGNYKTNYFVYLIDLFDEDKRTFMKRIEELEPPTRDKTKNFLLQMIEESRKEGQEEAREEIRENSTRKMIMKGLNTDMICNIMEVSPDYVHRIRALMEDE